MDLTNGNAVSGNAGQAAELNGFAWKSLLEGGLTWLRTNQELVNALNVFPVPDGDTGTNMMLTMQSGWAEISLMQENHAGQIMKALAQGALMGARGNSGVILSQIWRGFSRAMDGHKTVTMELFSKALTEAKNTAYKGVVRPVEGTILTVLKDTANEVADGLSKCENFEELLELTVKAAEASLDRTPELLPVLKQAGVVDSGGKGLFCILEGFLRAFKGEPLVLENQDRHALPLLALDELNEEETIEPGQDYEVVVDFIPSKELELGLFYDRLLEIGTSVQVGEGDNMYRMHIHVPTENLYAPINYIMTLGTVTKVAIENLMAQMDDIVRKNAADYELSALEEGQIGVVAVAPGEGIAKVLAGLGVNAIIAGGQTMNPSTEQILNAVNELPTDKVIILPNNKNIILSAQNAISQTEKKVAVIRSKNIPQGISALLQYDPDGEFDEIVEAMDGSLTEVESGEITCATRSVVLDGLEVKEGQCIAIHNGQLKIAEDELKDCLMAFLEEATTEDCESITMFYGNDMSESEAQEYADLVSEKYPDHEVQCHFGGQPHYYFIIAIE